MNDVKQHYLFKRTTAEDNVSTNHEHCFICSEDTAWDDVIRQFAMFLDESGYVGVYEKVDIMLEDQTNERWRSVNSLFGDGE